MALARHAGHSVSDRARETSAIVSRHTPALAPFAARRAMERKTATACRHADSLHTSSSVGIGPSTAGRVRTRSTVSPSGHQAPPLAEEKALSVARADWSLARAATGIGVGSSNDVSSSAIASPVRRKASMVAMASAGLTGAKHIDASGRVAGVTLLAVIMLERDLFRSGPPSSSNSASRPGDSAVVSQCELGQKAVSESAASRPTARTSRIGHALQRARERVRGRRCDWPRLPIPMSSASMKLVTSAR
jgi:hypothetical protein